MRELTYDLNSMGWGEVKSINPGRHKRSPVWSRVRNNLLHVKLINAKLNNIPNIFWLCGHEVYVTKPGEKNQTTLWLLQKPWHLEVTCWKKRQKEEDDRREKEVLQRKLERAQYLEERKQAEEKKTFGRRTQTKTSC